MQIRTFAYHMADKLLPVGRPYEEHALSQGASRTIVGFVLVALIAPSEAGYLLNGLREPSFDHPLVFGLELLLGVSSISYTLGLLTFGLAAWFRRHVPYRWPVRRVREVWREHLRVYFF